MLDLKEINLEQITFDEFITYKYVPRKVRKRIKSKGWAAAKIAQPIEQPIEYATFKELLEEVITTDFAVQVSILAPPPKQGKGGRFYIVNRNELDDEKIKEISKIVSNKPDKDERYLNIYMTCKHGKVEEFDHFLRFDKLDNGRIALTYLQIPGGERPSYSWQGDMRDYRRIYATLPVKRN